VGAPTTKIQVGPGSAADLRKHFVVDTNVLLHNPNALFKFEEHEVVIPLQVIEELDHFKKNNDETGRFAVWTRCAPLGGSLKAWCGTSKAVPSALNVAI
jgi:hypothetical protein